MIAPPAATGTAAVARALLAAACLALALPAPGLGRAQAACSIDAGGFRAVVPAAGAGELRLQGLPGDGWVQIASPGGICYLVLRRPDTVPAPRALRQDDLEQNLFAQIRRARIHGVEVDYAMPVPEVSRGGLPLRLGWTQLRDEGRRYAADTLLDPDSGTHVHGICALRDLAAAADAEAFLRSVHLELSPDLPGDCRR